MCIFCSLNRSECFPIVFFEAANLANHPTCKLHTFFREMIATIYGIYKNKDKNRQKHNINYNQVIRWCMTAFNPSPPSLLISILTVQFSAFFCSDEKFQKWNYIRHSIEMIGTKKIMLSFFGFSVVQSNRIIWQNNASLSEQISSICWNAHIFSFN